MEIVNQTVFQFLPADIPVIEQRSIQLCSGKTYFSSRFHKTKCYRIHVNYSSNSCFYSFYFFLSSPRPILPLKVSNPSYMNRVLLSLEFFFFCYIYCCNSFPMFSITYKATILSFTYCNVFTTFSVTTHNKGISPAIAAFFVVEIRHDSYYI